MPAIALACQTIINNQRSNEANKENTDRLTSSPHKWGRPSNPDSCERRCLSPNTPSEEWSALELVIGECEWLERM